MKFLVVAACVLLTVQALTDEQREKIKQLSPACAASVQMDQESIENAKRGTFADDDKFKNYLFCMSKKIGSQNEAGEIQKDVIKQKATVELKDEIIKKCAIVVDTPQHRASDIAKCYYANDPKHFSLV